MNRLLRLLSALVLPLIMSGALHAQSNMEMPPSQAGNSAEVLFTRAKKFFDDKNYQAALGCYLQFKADYGETPEFAVASFNSLFPIAICFVQLSRFPEAILAIKEVLEKPSPTPQAQLTPRQRQDLTFWLGVAQLQEKNYADARTALENFIALFPPDSEKNPLFVRQNPPAARIGAAKAMIETCFILQGKIKDSGSDPSERKSSNLSDTPPPIFNTTDPRIRFETPTTLAEHESISAAIESTRPENGTIFLQTARHSGGSLKVTNGTKWDAVVKLVSPYRKYTFVSFYVREGRTAIVNQIRANTYKLVFALGEGWDERRGRFHRIFSTSAFESPLTISKDAFDSYNGYSVTLNPVIGGNAEIGEISEEEFLSY